MPFVERGQDGQADIMAIHPAAGVVVIEVKGGRITAEGGDWRQDGRRLRKSPVAQAVGAKHALLRKVTRVCEASGVEPLWFCHAVAFPDAASVPEEWLGPDLEASMVLTDAELQWPDEALARLMPARRRAPSAVIEAMVRALRPDLEFGRELGPRLEAMTRRLDAETEGVLRTAEALDANRRVWVDGPAGSGKSRLAMRWARRASARGERVLLMCFNKPMGAIFDVAFDDDPAVTAGNFHDVALHLLEPTGFEVPEHASREFWEDDVPTALLDRRDQLGVGYDTIILDEVQDIRPHWFPAIEDLLDSAGSGRLYRLGDQSQNVYRVASDDAEGWIRFPLAVNCRNTKAIAAVAVRLGGGEPFSTSPEGPPVRFVRASGVREVRKRIGGELLTLLRERRLPPSSIAVITTRADLRDAIFDPPIAAARLVRWEERSEDAVVCETAHRLKGTEWEAVIVANLEPATTDWLREILYVGVSRPRTWLSVIAPDDTAALLGLTAG